MAYAGKAAIVTGGASGIGKGISQHLVFQGARVAVADMNAITGEQVVKELNEGHDEPVAVFVPLDASSWISVCALFATTKTAFGGRIDFVFANAGITQMQDMRSNDPTHFASTVHESLETLADRPPSLKVIEVDLHGVLYAIHASLAYFRTQEKDEAGWRGKIVATASSAALYPFPNDTLYGAAKTGVWGACRSIGPRVFSEGITVNCFAPSLVATGLAPPGFFERVSAEDRETPMQTVLDGIDMFLRPESRITGQILENVVRDNVFRTGPVYRNAPAKVCMDEFWPTSETDAALSLEGLEVVIL